LLLTEKKSDLWKKMGEAKGIFIESKGSKECNETVSKYYERIDDSKYKGAILFAVCRGKISEGIDFADNNGRAVIIIGLPYPSLFDPRVKCKRQFLEDSRIVRRRPI
jgi:Rad3-related DNA helicase